MRRVLIFFTPMLLIFAWIGWDFVPRRLPRPELLDALPVPVEGSVEGQSPDALLERTRAAYASAETYRDEGWIRNVYIEGEERSSSALEHFRLAFSRPDRLAWQWRRLERTRYLQGEFVDLLQRGDEVRFHSTRSLGLVQGRTAALSSIAAWAFHDPLRLLFPGELSGAWLDVPAETRVVGNERFDGHDCFRIEGICTKPDEGLSCVYEVWIDRDSHLLRRLTVRTDFGDWILESIFVFSPRTGGELQARELELDERF